MSEGSLIIEMYKELSRLLRGVDDKFDKTREDFHLLREEFFKLRGETNCNREQIEAIKQSLTTDFREIDASFKRWDVIWKENKRYVYFSLFLGSIGATATLGFNTVIDILKKFLSLK